LQEISLVNICRGQKDVVPTLKWTKLKYIKKSNQWVHKYLSESTINIFYIKIYIRGGFKNETRKIA